MHEVLKQSYTKSFWFFSVSLFSFYFPSVAHDRTLDLLLPKHAFEQQTKVVELCRGSVSKKWPIRFAGYGLTNKPGPAQVGAISKTQK